MNRKVDCDTLRELIPAYSIGAADLEETRLFEAGLSNCPYLAAELAAYRAAFEPLMSHVPQVQPPAAALDDLLRATRTRRPAARRPVQRRWWLAVAAVLVFVVLNNVFWIAQIQPENPVFVSAQVINLPTAQNGQETGARGQVIWIPETAQALLVVEKFPEQRDDIVYQAWVTRGTQIISLGVFDVNPLGSGSLVFDTALLSGSFDALGVTPEPAGGSDAPTSPPVVRWRTIS